MVNMEVTVVKITPFDTISNTMQLSSNFSLLGNRIRIFLSIFAVNL
jgi:hypothetical protein